MSFISFLQIPISILAFALIIVPVIAAHEFGHFAAARLLGIRVASFSIGFGRELWGRTSRSGVRWRLSAIPFGGYVSFGDRAAPGPEPVGFKARLFAPPPSDGFSRAPAFRRLIVLLAGPAASFGFAFAVFFTAWLVFGVSAPGLSISGVDEDGPAAAAGLRAGDHVVSADEATGERTIFETIATSAGKTIRFVVERDGSSFERSITVASKPVDTALGVKTLGRIGVAIVPSPRRFDPIGAARLSAQYFGFLSTTTVAFFVGVTHGQASMNDLSSPVGIAAISGRLLQRNVEMFIRFAGAVSFGLGVTNLLPIPGLDGGQSVIAIIEMASRRRLSPRALAGVTLGGLALAFGMVLAVMVGEVGSVFEYAFSH